MTSYVGHQFGNYRVLRPLGEGHFATIYLAEHLYLETLAAVKVLHVRIKPESYESFLAEARIIAHLQHPHIIHIIDFGIQDQTPYLVMDYAPNGTLRSLYPEGTSVPEEQIISYVQQVASAIDYAHEQHVIHRDIKPDNILLNAKHEVILSDFGIAVVQNTLDEHSPQHPAGTPLYMAPEQIRGKPCPASDQYALGVMVYQWLYGEPPFRGPLMVVFRQHLQEPPPSLCARLPLLSSGVEEVVFGALAKDPEQRFSSTLDFASALAKGFLATQLLPSNISIEHMLQDEVILPLARANFKPVRLVGAQGSDTTPPRLESVQQSEREQEQVPRLTTDTPTITPQHSPVSITPHQTLVPALRNQNRAWLLRRVRSFWIIGVLEQSLRGVAFMPLELEEQSDAVANPWDQMFSYPNIEPRPLPAGTRITQVYDNADGELLILGAPGSGKTILLLELTRDLLNRAEQDESHPMPVVFNLSSWAIKKQPLVDWLIEELNSKYQVPRKLGQALVHENQMLPLLDGLDEMTPEDRTACIKVINDYRKEHGLWPLVVCSRSADYLGLKVRVLLRTAVVIQPLSDQRVNDYLARIGKPLHALRLALERDSSLRDLTHTPLMLHILTLTYSHMPVIDVLDATSSANLVQQIFARYVDRMLVRGSNTEPYSFQDASQWLSWLAKQLKQRNQTIFYMERMQPDWLEEQRRTRPLYPRAVFGLIVGLLGMFGLGSYWRFILASNLSLKSIFLNSPSPIVNLVSLCGLVILLGLINGSILGLVNGLLYTHKPGKVSTSKVRWWWRQAWRRVVRSVRNGVLMGLLVGCPYGFILGRHGDSNMPVGEWILLTGVTVAILSGLLYGLVDGLLHIQMTTILPTETLAWQWTNMGRNLIKFLVLGLLCSLVTELLVGLLIWALSKGNFFDNVPFLLQFALIFVPFFALLGVLLGGFTGGVSTDVLDERNFTKPNQGIRHSMRYSIQVGIIILSVVIGITLIAMSSGIGSRLSSFGFIFGPLIALVCALNAGGIACIQHFVLRWLLWREKKMPWNYPRFLDYAAKRVLLAKVGGGYMFVHRLLLEHFASLD